MAEHPAPATIQERAEEALSRAGELLAGAEAGVRHAIVGLNQAIDLAHSAEMTPDLARSLVTRNARLGDIGRFYLAEETSAWEAVYDPSWKPGSARAGDELVALHARQRPAEGGSMAAAGQALTAVGMQLAQAEDAFETALDRFEDAADFAVHAGVLGASVHDLVCAWDTPGPIGSDYVALTAASWNIYTEEATARKAGMQAPAAFWDIDLLARAAKGTGRYDTAAAIWLIAGSVLPEGHGLRGELDEMVTALRAAARTGQYVSPDGRLIPPHTAAVIGGDAGAVAAQPPPGPGAAPAIAAQIWEHITARSEQPGWRVIYRCWDPGDATAVTGDATTLEAALAALAPFVDACAGRGLVDWRNPGGQFTGKAVVTAPPGWADDALPGWFPARITPYGPGYSRYVPGKGMLQVGYENRQYRWWLPAGPGRDGFATGRQAMRDADRLAGMDFPGGSAARSAASPARRPAGRGVTSAAARAGPRRLL